MRAAECTSAPRSGWALASAAVLLLASGVRCNTDHEQLAQRPGSGGTGTTTTSGSGGTSATTSLTSTQTSTTSGSGGTMHYTPDGDDVLTLVHGQVDAERIAFCLGRPRDDGPTRFDSPPIPAGGLGYGESFTLSEAADLDFEDDDLELVVLSGEFETDAECSEIFDHAYWPARIHEPEPEPEPAAGGAAGAAGAGAGLAGAGGADAVEWPPLRALALPTIPANSLVLGRHYVMVLAGCMGGPGVVDSGGHCGANYTPAAPNLRALLVPVSREVEPGRVSLQFLHASAATPEVDVQSVPNMFGSGVQIYLSSRVRFGAIAPKDPYRTYSSDELGIGDGAQIVVYADNANELRARWRDVAGSMEIADEHSYLAILLGPSVGTNSDAGFNESLITLLGTGLGRDE